MDVVELAALALLVASAVMVVVMVRLFRLTSAGALPRRTKILLQVRKRALVPVMSPF